MTKQARQVDLGNNQIWIQLHGPAQSCLSVVVENSARDHRRSQPIESHGAGRLKLGRAPREVFSVGKALGVQGPAARLDEDETERHQHIGIGSGKLDGFSISIFSIIPPVLIDIDIPQTVERSRIVRL